SLFEYSATFAKIKITYIMRQISALFLTLSLTFFSCSQDKDTYTLEGDAIGFADGTEIFVSTFENKQAKVIDTLVIENGKFSATYPLSNSLNVNFLSIKETNGNVIYFPENENLTATLYKDSLQASRVSGGKQNEAYSEFLAKTAEFNSKKQASMEAFRKAQQENDAAAAAQVQSANLNLMAEETKYKKEFLSKHDKSLFSIMLLSEMVGRGEITVAEAKAYMQELRPELESSDITQELKTQLESMGKAEIGEKAPEFSAK